MKEVQERYWLVTRKTTILRLIFVSKIKSKISFIGFHDFLKSSHIIESDFFTPKRKINLSCLNQACVENLFSVIRGKGGHRDNPDVNQFTSAL